MKKLRLFLSLSLLMLTTLLFAQSVPQAINFQAIARDEEGEIMPNTDIMIQLSIIDGTANGPQVYREIRSLHTNSYGSFSFQIGRDPYLAIGNFADIDWGGGPKFLKLDYDPTATLSFNLSLGIIELVTVPYAFAAGAVSYIDANGASNGDILVFNAVTGRFEPQSVNMGGIIEETDPTVPAWAKENEKPTYYYDEILGAPEIPEIPTNVSAFNNDMGYLTSYDESDPTVPTWAKEENKPEYDYSEIKNTPEIPELPTNVSAFENDALYLTEESDPTVPEWAKEENKPMYDYSEIQNTPEIPEIPTNVSAFENDALYLTEESDPTVPEWAKKENKPIYDYSEIQNTPQLQVLSFSNDTLYLTGGSFVVLPEEAHTLADITSNGNSANAQIKNVIDPTDAQDAATKAYIDEKIAYLNARIEYLENLHSGNGDDTLTTYTVTFNANGGAGVMQQQIFSKGMAQVLTPNAFTWENHNFKDWNTASDGTGTTYADKQEITITENTTLYAQWNALQGELNGYEWIDLGLPSGTLWATCNVGASSPTDYGNYYAWGETDTKSNYDENTYKYFYGEYGELTKYCDIPGCGYNGFADNLTVLQPEDDAATVIWGEGWRMPTSEDFTELQANCTCVWGTQNGVNGFIFTSPNGNSIFLPAAGSYYLDNIPVLGEFGCYWSNSLTVGDPYRAWFFYFDPEQSESHAVTSMYRTDGMTVRPVVASPQTEVDIQLPSVTTDSVIDISHSYAKAVGTVLNNGGASVTQRGVCWDTIPNPTLFLSSTDGMGIGSFTCTLYYLKPNTTYYVRAYAANSKGIAYGNQIAFTTTDACKPTVVTSDATSITRTSAVFSGDVTDTGGTKITAKGFYYGTSPNPIVTGKKINININNGFTREMTELTPDTTYYVCAFATNNKGTGYGEVKSFIAQDLSIVGALNAKYSIGSDKQVYFSQGNLQYQAATDTWRFAENQWDTDSIDAYIIEPSPSDSSWRHLFGWGTGNNPTNLSEDYDDYGIFSEWGNNPISNGGNSANQWRTLTKDEWEYLVLSRTTTSGIRYAKAVVNGVNGMIILPDGYINNYPLNYTNTNAPYSHNTITLSDWNNKFESQGVVFLPAEGERRGVTVNSGIYGNYWSSTLDDSETAFELDFGDTFLGVGTNYCYRGLSVRLVTNE